MFPDDWSVDKIKWEVKGAWNSSSFSLNGREWKGISPSGIEIKGFVNPNRTLAYPIYEEGELK